MRQRTASYPKFLVGGVLFGLLLAAGYLSAVAVLGIGRPLVTGSAWVSSMIASAPGPMQLVAIVVLYATYGGLLGSVVGSAAYAIRRASQSRG